MAVASLDTAGLRKEEEAGEGSEKQDCVFDRGREEGGREYRENLKRALTLKDRLLPPHESSLLLLILQGS